MRKVETLNYFQVYDNCAQSHCFQRKKKTESNRRRGVKCPYIYCVILRHHAGTCTVRSPNGQSNQTMIAHSSVVPNREEDFD